MAKLTVPAEIYKKCQENNHSRQKKAFITMTLSCVYTPRVISAALDASYFIIQALT
jgi:hypothetical protein